jgi:hypothetical protein
VTTAFIFSEAMALLEERKVIVGLQTLLLSCNFVVLIFYFVVQTVWKLDPTVQQPTWTYVSGSNVTDTHLQNQPNARSDHSCDAAPSAGSYCYGGRGKIMFS